MDITETFDAKTYAMDAVMTLALALNETLLPPSSFNGTSMENPQIDTTALKSALQAVTFSGASVSKRSSSEYVACG